MVLRTVNKSLRAGVLNTVVFMYVVLQAVVSSAADNAKPIVEEAFVGDPDQLVFDSLTDPAFEKFVDIRLLGHGVAEQDVELLTDLALQLAHGESTLLRSHRSISADQVFQVAIRVAEEHGDEAGLGRLQKAVAGRDKSLTERIAAAMLLASASREVEEPIVVAIDDVTPETLAVYQDLIGRISLAQATGNASELDAVNEDLGATGMMTEDQVDKLRKKVQAAKQAIGNNGGADSADVLSALAGASRGWFKNSTGFSTPKPIRSIAPNGISIGRRNTSDQYPSVLDDEVSRRNRNQNQGIGGRRRSTQRPNRPQMIRQQAIRQYQQRQQQRGLDFLRRVQQQVNQGYQSYSP